MSPEPFSHIVLVARIPPAGRHVRLAPDESARVALAAFVGVIEISRLTAAIEMKPVQGGAISLRGRLEASVVQEDVVTLEPVASDLSEEIDVILRPAERPARGRTRAADEEGVREDEADVYHDGRIDLGALAAEHLAIGLDPYPRAPGVEFPGHVEDDPDTDESPFASLAKLKRGDG